METTLISISVFPRLGFSILQFLTQRAINLKNPRTEITDYMVSHGNFRWIKWALPATNNLRPNRYNHKNPNEGQLRLTQTKSSSTCAKVFFSISKSTFGQTDLGKHRYLSLSTQIAADRRRYARCRDLGALLGGVVRDSRTR